MKRDVKKDLKLKQIEFVIQSDEYPLLLKEVSDNITIASKAAENEASIVSVFELELFNFIKEHLGLKYYPKKEVKINTVRHISKGRIDSKIGALVIEYKHTSKLKSIEHKTKASNQLIDYLKGLNVKNSLDYIGIVTDGTQCKIIIIEKGKITEGAFEKLASKHIDKIIRSIVLLEKVALTPENLVKDFCASDSSISKRLTLCLYKTLKNHPTGRSLMLFDEWKELFRLAHNDNSKQKAIEERKKSLEDVIGSKLKENNQEYLALYALQTTYAIIVKVIAYKVISKIRFKKSLIDFDKLSEADFSSLRHEMNSLEEGAIFRELGSGVHISPINKKFAKPLTLARGKCMECPSGSFLSLSYFLLFIGLQFTTACFVFWHAKIHRLIMFCSPASSFGFGVEFHFPPAHSNSRKMEFNSSCVTYLSSALRAPSLRPHFALAAAR